MKAMRYEIISKVNYEHSSSNYYFKGSYLLPWEPTSFLDLVLVHFDVSRYGDGEAANHEVGGHRPGLAGHVLNRSDLHTALLLHLPPHRLLERLPCKDTGTVSVCVCV